MHDVGVQPMNGSQASDPADAIESEDCYHCGAPVQAPRRYFALVDGAQRAMCCPGCQAVAQFITANGLTSYYKQRTAFPGRIDNAAERARSLAAYRLPDIEATVSRVARDGRESVLMLEGVTCAACAWLIEQRISRLPGVLRIEVNYATQRALVRWDDQRTQLASVLGAIADLGYEARPSANSDLATGWVRERQRLLLRLLVAGFGMMQVMMYLLPIYIGQDEMTDDVRQLMRIAGLVLTAPVVFYAAAGIFAAAWRSLRLRQIGMDVPVALGIGSAFVASTFATVSGHGEVYFDSITMFVFLLLAARALEAWARMRAEMLRERMLRQVPRTAEVLRGWPGTEPACLVAADTLRPGDHVRVRPGCTIPADGVVAAGESMLDERLLTGESHSRHKRPGDDLTGGSINVQNPLIMRVTRAGAATVLSGIVQLLEKSLAEKPRIGRGADRVARIFVWSVLALAAVTCAMWYAIEPVRALATTVAVLVVSCPCALSLATPAAIAAATAALHERGVLVTRPDAIEGLARATDFVFDKTGTLTRGNLQLTAVCAPQQCADDERARVLALAAALESGSSHPVATALCAAASGEPVAACEGAVHVAGSGIEGRIDGRRMRIGTPRYVAEICRAPLPPALSRIADDAVMVALGDETRWIAWFTFADSLRPYARSLVAELLQAGRRVHLVSGDRAATVAHVARTLGIAHWHAEATPADKLRYVQDLQARAGIVAMIGDGVNDAAGLGAAQVSIAIGGGADLAGANSDVLLLNGRLDGLLTGMRIARRALAIVQQNLAWALAYNLGAIPLAAFGYITPLAAGAGMALSSMLVTANSVRLIAHERPGRHAVPGDPATQET